MRGNPLGGRLAETLIKNGSINPDSCCWEVSLSSGLSPAYHRLIKVIFTTLDAVLSTARWRCGTPADMCLFVLVVSSRVRGLVCSKATAVAMSTNVHKIDVVLHVF